MIPVLSYLDFVHKIFLFLFLFFFIFFFLALQMDAMYRPLRTMNYNRHTFKMAGYFLICQKCS